MDAAVIIAVCNVCLPFKVRQNGLADNDDVPSSCCVCTETGEFPPKLLRTMNKLPCRNVPH